MTERSYRIALEEAPRLEAAMREAGWNTGVVLWTPQVRLLDARCVTRVAPALA